MCSFLGQKVLCQQIDERGVDQETRGNGVEDTHDNQTKGRVRVVRAASSKTNGLADGSSRAESNDEEPGTRARLGVGNVGNTCSETETLEHLVEDDGDEKDDEALGSDGDGHTDKDRVEQDTTFNERNLHRLLLEHQRVNGLLDVVVKVRVLSGCGCLLLVVGKSRHGTVDGGEHLVTLADVLLVEDDEPGWHLRLAVQLVAAALGEGEAIGRVGGFLVPSTLLVTVGHHGLLGIVAFDAANGVVEVGTDSCGGLSSVESLASSATVAVTTGLLVKPHLNNEEDEERAHHDDTGESRVVIGKEIWQAWVVERGKSSRQKLSSISWVLWIAVSGWLVLTWTKAVAIRTPVPKCLQKKKTFGGIFIHLTFLATTGKPAPKMDAKKTMTRGGLACDYSVAPGHTYKRRQRAGESHIRHHPSHCRKWAFPCLQPW